MSRHRASRYVGRRGRRLVERVTTGVLLITGAVVVVPLATATPSQAAPAFLALADSSAFQFTEQLPGFPGGQTPFNGGGPTGQARLDSLGNTQGYAAFPDPGPVAIGGPALGYGLFKSGAGGLPPIEPPGEPPKYPLYVSSDQSTPESSVDAGFFALRAASSDSLTTGSARAGFLTPGASRAAEVFADARITKAPDGAVVSTASTDGQSLVIGDLTIGQLLTTATMALSADGGITRSSDVRLTGVSLAGHALQISGSGADAAQSEALNQQLAALLKGSGYSVRVTAPQNPQNAIVAPGIEITGPFEVPTVTNEPGTFTMRLGTAIASLIRTGAEPSAFGSTTTTSSTARLSGDTLGGMGSSSGASSIGASVPGLAPTVGAVRLPPVNLALTGRAAGAAAVSPLTAGDITSFYWMLALFGVAMLVAPLVTRAAGFGRGRR